MGLTVETGAVVADADSYVTLHAYQAYASARGWAVGANDAADEQALRRAFDGLNRLWTYAGTEASPLQVGAFPRSGSSAVPEKVKQAQCELAHLIQGGLDPFVSTGGGAQKESIKIGPISIAAEQDPDSRARMVAVEALLRPFTGLGGNQVKLVRG
jgi:hypothetical protein